MIISIISPQKHSCGLFALIRDKSEDARCELF